MKGLFPCLFAYSSINFSVAVPHRSPVAVVQTRKFWGASEISDVYVDNSNRTPRSSPSKKCKGHAHLRKNCSPRAHALVFACSLVWFQGCLKTVSGLNMLFSSPVLGAVGIAVCMWKILHLHRKPSQDLPHNTLHSCLDGEHGLIKCISYHYVMFKRFYFSREFKIYKHVTLWGNDPKKIINTAINVKVAKTFHWLYLQKKVFAQSARQYVLLLLLWALNVTNAICSVCT